MRILISNDDGIFAPGLAALVHAFAAAGHTVYVAAPDSQRSAASHSMTLFQPLTAKKSAVAGASKAWAIDGTPVDCVKLAVKTLCPEVDFVHFGNQPWLQFRLGCAVFRHSWRGDGRRAERQTRDGGFTGA